MKTRRWIQQWGIQQLASTHQLPHKPLGGTLDQLKSKVPSPDKISIFGGGGNTADQLKSQVPSPDQIFIYGGEGVLQTIFLKYLSGGTQRIFRPKFLLTGMW